VLGEDRIETREHEGKNVVFELTEDVLETTVPLYGTLNPYDDTTPAGILGRNSILTKSFLTGASFVRFRPVGALYNVPTFNNCIISFAYFRFAAVELTIVFDFPTLYGGALMVNSWPGARDYFSALFLDPASSLDPIMVTAGMNQVVKLVLPWMSPKECFSTVSDPDATINDMWTIRLCTTELNKTNSLQSAPSVNYTIFGRFLDPECIMPYARLESGNLFTPSRVFGATGIAGGAGYTLWNAFSAEAGKRFESFARESSKDVLDYGSNYLKSQMDSNSTKHVGTMTTGNVPASAGAIRQDFRVDPYGDTSSCYQETDRQLRIIDPTSSVRAVPRYPSKGDWSVRELIMRPSMHAVAAVTTVGSPFVIPVMVGSFSKTAMSFSRWVDYFAQYYRFWRGGIKYRVYLILPPTQSTRVQISLAYANDSSLVADVSDSLSRQITVEGTVIVDFVVPYVRPSPWSTCCPAVLNDDGRDFNQFTVQPYLQIVLLTPILTDGDVAPRMQVLVFSAAAEDFEFDGFAPQIPVNVPMATVVLQSSVFEAFSKPFDGFCGTPLVEHRPSCSMTVRDIATRYSNRTSPDLLELAMSPNFVPGGGGSLYDSILELFFFRAGPVSVKSNVTFANVTDGWVASPQSVHPEVTALYPFPIQVGAVMFNTNFFPTIEFESPYVSLYDWTYSNPTADAHGDAQFDTGVPYIGTQDPTKFHNILISATPKTMFMIPMCPPPQSTWFCQYIDGLHG